MLLESPESLFIQVLLVRMLFARKQAFETTAEGACRGDGGIGCILAFIAFVIKRSLR
jgi:hypothetical protein